MQAQASGEGGGSILQNQKFQIGIIVAGALALIGVIVMVVNPFGGAAGETSNPVNPAPVSGASGVAGAVSDDPAGEASFPAATGTPGPAGLPGGAGGPSLPGESGLPGSSSAAAPAGGAEGGPVLPPGVATRPNPFAPNSDLRRVIASIPKPPGIVDDTVAPELHVYAELKPPTPAQSVEAGDEEGPPVPAMRVAGVVFGGQVTATMQIGSTYQQVKPGQMVPESNPVYRVERIEQDRVHLTRRWEQGTRKGVQRIEVTLQGAAARAGVGAFAGGARGAGGGNAPGGNMPGF